MANRQFIRSAVSRLVVLVALCMSSALAQTGPARADSSRIRAQLGQLCNEVRVQKGYKPLVRLDYLDQAALNHSADMCAKDYFGHESPTQGQRTFRDRITLAGGFDPAMGENIYQCRGIAPERVAERVIKAWLASPAHRANLLNKNFNGVGFGVICDGETTTVTQNFACRQISVESLVTSLVSNGVEFTLKGRVISGALQGAVFVDQEFRGLFSASNDGCFEVSGVAPAGSTIKVTQKKTETRFSAALVVPAEAGLCWGGAEDTAAVDLETPFVP